MEVAADVKVLAERAAKACEAHQHNSEGFRCTTLAGTAHVGLKLRIRLDATIKIAESLHALLSEADAYIEDSQAVMRAVGVSL